MPPPLDSISWELLAEGIYAVQSGPCRLVVWIWTGYVANRDHIVPIATFLGAGAIAWAALRQAKTATLRHAEQTRADRERRITESFAVAGEQLGSDKLETRLVGIYTLERISQESDREYWPIMETLTAFVRERAPWPQRQAVAQSGRLPGSSAGEPANEAEPASVKARPKTDIQAILTVLGRRDEKARERDQAAGRSLDLAATDLQGADLRLAYLEGADLRLAYLEGADLREAYLEGADLREAHLDGADLRGASLDGADLREAHLEGANLRLASLDGADLREAHLEGAGLGNNLTRARGLTQEQVIYARGDEKTTLPADLIRPGHWPAAAPDEPDNPRWPA